MSYIDCFNHSNVGTFLGWPIYHPLEKLDEEGFEADTNNLLIGGGGCDGQGESPSMVIDDLSYCVLCYLLFFFDEYLTLGKEDDDNTHVASRVVLDAFADKYELLDPDLNYQSNLFHQWDFETIARFSKAVKAHFTLNPHWGGPGAAKLFNKNFKKRFSVERKLHILIGEIVLFYTPRLMSVEMQILVAYLRGLLQTEGYSVHRLFHNAFEPAVSNWNSSGGIKYTDETGVSRTHCSVSYLDEEKLLEHFKGRINWSSRSSSQTPPDIESVGLTTNT